jgi:holliday junction DNA helicase RuvB
MKFTENKNTTIISGKQLPADKDADFISLRPKNLSEYIGQTSVVNALNIAISAAKKREESIEHILFHGPPGLGKTTMAHIIANEMEANITTTSGPALEKGGDLLGILTHLEKGDLLFIDEIHRIPKVVEEFLYPAMEDFAVDFVFDKGIHARTHKYRLNNFTLIGATTRAGLISAPLRDRFGILKRLDFYDKKELMSIAFRSADILNIKIDKKSAEKLSERARGTPRVINRLLKRVRDYAQVKGDGNITENIVEQALFIEGIDNKGLTSLDRAYLETIIKFYNGGPVGIEAIAATIQEESDTLVDMVEPYLLNSGFVIRTSSGRKALPAACMHLGLTYNTD